MANDYELPILYAKDSKGAYRFIDEVPNGDACGCTCPACDQPMRARNNGLKRRHSFAHQPGKTCTWAVETVITALAKQAIEESGCIAMPALYYENAVTGKVERLSESRLMRVVGVETVTVSGRQAPCLVVTVQGGAHTARFGVCITLRRKLTFEQEEQLLAETRGVVLVDLGVDLARQRKEQDRHYDRDELILGYQDKGRLSEILLERSSDLMNWLRNARRDECEERSVTEKAEVDRREAEERAEAEREYEEARRRDKKAREREARERAEREAREGIVREPDSYVTEYEEYDIRQWGDRRLPPGETLAPNERYVVNGALEALLVEDGGRTRVIIRCQMSLDAINEVSWKLAELSDGFASLTLALDTAHLRNLGLLGLAKDTDGDCVLTMKGDAREYCCALQGLVCRGVRVVLFGVDTRMRVISRIDVGSGKVILV